jgi:hypothetical protein
MDIEIEKQLTLTEEQQNIYETLIKFVKSDKNQEILLTSAAGTGKTTLVTYFINNLIKNKLCNKIAIACPTHKSLNIVKNKLFTTNEKIEISNNVDVMTIHRLLNYQKIVDTSGEVYYSKGKTDSNWSIYNLVVVDECSMLSNQIIDDIEHEIKKEKNKKLKILYTGDFCQLSPVNQEESKIFSKNIKKLTLKKIIRTNSNNIIELSNGHRKWISSNKDEDMPFLKDFQNNNVILYPSEKVNEWLTKFIDLLKENTNGKNKIKNENIIDSDKMENNIILTWTNKKCNKYNDFIRHKMFNKKELAKYEIGEILIFNDFHRITFKKKINNNDSEVNYDSDDYEDKIVSFYTSEQIKLKSIKEDVYKFEKIKNLKNTELSEIISNKFIVTVNEINKLLVNTSLNVYYMKVQKMSELKKNEEANIYDIMTIHNNSEPSYTKLKDYFEEKMIKLKNQCYKIVNDMKKEDNMLKLEYLNIIEKKINRIWKDWQTNVIDRFAQLNYGYAITVHKSQGSTFKNVFIDIMDIFENYNQKERLKCLYTAITRSSNSLQLLI